jgi:ribosome biogenesis protein SSF1/2
MAGPLGVSHLLLFSRSATGNTNLRLAVTPRGPTLHFRVEKYSLCKDVQKSMRHPKGARSDFLTPPLLVMNNLTSLKTTNGSTSSMPKQLDTLTTTVFQSLFPPISPQHTPLPSIRRVLILDRELSVTSVPDQSIHSTSYIIHLRHYAITTEKKCFSRGIRRINAAEKKLKESKNGNCLPNLGKLEDVAEYLLHPNAAGAGYISGSESEVETDVEVEILETKTRKVVNRRQYESANGDESEARRETPGVEKRAVKLVELGPRMTLRLTKIEEGVCGGRVMWHEYLAKSKEEINQMEKIWEGRRQEREYRKSAQRENVERKKATNKASTNAIDGNMEMDDEEEWE